MIKGGPRDKKRGCGGGGWDEYEKEASTHNSMKRAAHWTAAESSPASQHTSMQQAGRAKGFWPSRSSSAEHRLLTSDDRRPKTSTMYDDDGCWCDWNRGTKDEVSHEAKIG